MICKIAEFRIKKEMLPECRTAIAEFVRAVREHEPGTLSYEAYQKIDNVSFIHFMCFRDAEAEEHHRGTPHVKKFVAVLYPNCDREPVFTDITPV